MVFNVHVTAIGDKSAANQQSSQAVVVERVTTQSLIHVPADKQINKYPVRIFDLQPQR